MKKQTPESAVLKQVLDYLAAKHVFSLRMNTGAMSAEHNGKKRFMRFGVPGMADVLAFTKIRVPDITMMGREQRLEYEVPIILWLECKAPNGKQSELQKSFQAQVEAEGHRYIIVRDVNDLDGIL